MVSPRVANRAKHVPRRCGHAACSHHPAVNDRAEQLATERTFLAWLRTGALLIGFGYAIAWCALYLDATGPLASRTRATYGVGFAMAVSGLVAVLFAALRYRASARSLACGGYVYWFATLLGAVGLLMVVLLFVESA